MTLFLLFLFTNTVPLTNEDKNFNKNIKIRKRLECVKNDARISVMKNEMISFFSRTERRHTVHATLSLTCAPMCPNSLTGKLTAKQSRSKSCGLFSVWRRGVVLAQSNQTQIVISITSVVVECVVVSSYR